MKRVAFSSALIAITALLAAGERSPGARVLAAVAGEHDYFDSLSRRLDVWKSYSVRTAAQVASRQLGGFAQGNSTAVQWVTYSPETDTDRHRQDAAKVVIPAWLPNTSLAKAATASDTVLTLQVAARSAFPLNVAIRVDNEVMTVTSVLSDTTISVKRGQFATAAAAHALGAPLLRSNNSLPNSLHLPLGTEDGRTYFFTWEIYWTDSYLGSGSFNHKAFQFTSGGANGDLLWVEPGVKYGGTNAVCTDPRLIGNANVRAYNKLGGVADWLQTDGDRLGPSVLGNEPMRPFVDFCVEPNTWTRYFVFFRQKANDYDTMDMWIADETRDPIQVLSGAQLSVRGSGLTPNSVLNFWLEFNTSSDNYFRVDNRDLVSYFRNFVALRDVPDTRGLLVRPVPGAEAISVPGAPRNVRIVSGGL